MVTYIRGQLVAPRVGAWVEIAESVFRDVIENVAPRVGAWVEICHWHSCAIFWRVAPRVGAWVEINSLYFFLLKYASLPAWERGLKFMF